MLFHVSLLAAVAAIADAFPQGFGGHGGGPPQSQSHPGGTSAGYSSTLSSLKATTTKSSVVTTSTHSTSAASSATAAISSLPWAPPGPGDIRSPCPALNSMANHFLIPHDGHYITAANVTAAFGIGMNISPDQIAKMAADALSQCTNQTGETCTGFHLGMLNTPHSIEHDGSLSRFDYNYGEGNNRNFNQSIWNQVLNVWSGASIIDFSLMQAARTERFAKANATDLPGWFEAEPTASYTETSLIMSVFGDPVLGNARKDWINYWISNERLPFALGWEATQRDTTTPATLAAMIKKIKAA